MDYFEHSSWWDKHIELVTEVGQKERRIRDLEKLLVSSPSSSLYEALQVAKAEYQEARKALHIHDHRDGEAPVLKTPYGGFHPRFPENPK